MKLPSFVLFFLILITTTLSAAPITNELPNHPSDNLLAINELKLLDNLIRITKENLKNQEELRENILIYQNDLALYLKNSSNKDIVLKMSKRAAFILNEIKKNHLTSSFEPDFISELSVFAQLIQKKGIPSP